MICGTSASKSFWMFAWFWFVGMQMLAAVQMPLSSKAYSWNRMPRGASTAPTPVAGLRP